MRRKIPESDRPGTRPVGRGDESREVYFELYPVGDSMKVSAIDSATGTEVSIVGPAKLPQAELERVALNKLHYVMNQKADEKERSTPAPRSGNDGKGWIV
ncbi:hypothetical protein QMT40_001685 [Parvibaculaceae bacterium PLY_AMNH_Bact1]|nr:hypothetical protein QMT40_001685 [Parvibaculaceae bacterium PLY_AMNH_Bact1]